MDGNDYWLWEAVSAVNPRIVVCEYNSFLGSQRPLVVPYAADFRRAQAHYSWLYYGASLPALEYLGRRKGYQLVGTNSAGNNAFFVRSDVGQNVPVRSAREAFTVGPLSRGARRGRQPDLPGLRRGPGADRRPARLRRGDGCGPAAAGGAGGWRKQEE